MTRTPEQRAAADAVIEWLHPKQRLLIVTHTRPDGDALGSLFGAYRVLSDMGKQVRAFVDAPIPGAYTSFAPADLIVDQPVDWADYDGLVCLDCATAKRLALPNGRPFAEIPVPAANLDHHVDNPGYGEVNLVVPQVAATAELLSHLFGHAQVTVSPDAATCLLIGVITDTGGFRHDNTTGATLRCAAHLVDEGGDYPRVIRAVYFRETPGLIRLKAKIYDSMVFACDGRFVSFALTPEMLAECEVDEADTEDIVDIVRTVAGVVVACRLQVVSEGIRVSLRSQNPQIPILEIAHKLGGGGHKMAAGAMLKQTTLADAQARILSYVKELLGG